MNIYNDMMRGFAYDLSMANNPEDVLLGWKKIINNFKGYKAIVVLDEYKELLLSKDIIKIIQDKESGFTPYFDSHKLYFVDNDSMGKMIQNYTVNIGIDYSIMFDTNFASYIDNFVRTGNPGVNLNYVYNAIDMLIKNDYKYDYNIYLMENIKIIDSYFDKNNYEVEVTEEMFRNIVSIELFKSIKSDVYRNTGKIEYSISYAKAKLQATEVINGLYRSSESKEYFRIVIDFQKQMLLNLIGMVKIQFSSNEGPRKKMEAFFKFIETTSGIYTDREARVAYEYFEKKNALKIFAKINKRLEPDKLFDLLDNIAWDFTIPRYMELFMMTCGEGDFLIPILLSVDKGLRSMLDIYSVKGFIFGKENIEFFPIPKKSTYDYFKERKCDHYIKKYDETRQVRCEILKINKAEGYKIIQHELKELQKLLINE